MMIDITENILEAADRNQDRLQEILDWLEQCIGPKTQDIIVVETGTTQYKGLGWEVGCMRHPGKTKRNTLTFYVKFDDEREELMFKLIWSNSTSQIICT
jgi:hypothetical protein